MTRSVSTTGLSMRASELSKRAGEIEKESKEIRMWTILSNLWDPVNNKDGWVSLGMAENWLMRKSISDHLRSHFDPPDRAFTYGDGATGSKRLKDATSKFLNYYFLPDKDVTPDHLSMTNGCSSALEHIGFALTNPNDLILIGRPYYGSFRTDFQFRFHGEVRLVEFASDDDRFDKKATVVAYEQAIKQAETEKRNVAALVLCNPHNPLGRCYPRETLVELMALCQRHTIHLVVDEIYALSAFENTVDKPLAAVPFVSVLSINPDGLIDGHHLHVIWGMSKDFGVNGLRVGAIISQYNDDLHKSLVATGLYTSISSLSDHVCVQLLEDEDWLKSYIPENQMRLSQAFSNIARWAQNHDIPYAKGASHGLFIWLDFGSKYRKIHPGVPEEGLEQRIGKALDKEKVFLAAGKGFGAEKQAWFRVIYSVSDYYIHEGMNRIIRALEAPLVDQAPLMN